jgi:hypothetical protein
MTETEIAASLRARREELAPLMEEYRRLVEADKLLTDLFGPIRKPRAARKPKPSPPPVPKQRVTLNVQTVGSPTPREMRDRDVAYVTQEG